jgi:calcium-dependent protein kinase
MKSAAPFPNIWKGEETSFDVKALCRQRHGDIAEYYEVEAKELASGGCGQVFLARSRDGRQVIIKKAVCTSETNNKRLKREVSIMQKLDHPNICRLYETYEKGKFLYFVLEYCQKGDLFSAIIEKEQLSEAETAEMIGQIASALKYAHSMCFAHRDLKPENICLTSRGGPGENHVKVIDWGLSGYFENQRMTSAVGTPTYAAPEVMEAKGMSEYTESCDLWSLGVLTYVMLSGKVPFHGSILEQLKVMKAERYDMSSAPWPAIPRDARDFVRRLIKANPADRMSISQACEHRWLQKSRPDVNKQVLEEVLFNVTMGSKRSKFLSLCVASAARQFDDSQLRDIATVFRRLDVGNKGSLGTSEFMSAFEEVHGPNSNHVESISEIMKHLDLDGSGRIDYTEFCAAALDETAMEQEALLAGFSAFDVEGDSGRVTIKDLEKVLSTVRCGDASAPDICNAISHEVVERFGNNKLGYLEFDGWKKMHAGMQRKVAWVSLDPRTGSIALYPQSVARRIEAGWVQKKASTFLPDFFNARVYYKSDESGLPFQRTPNGLRDVRRIHVDPRNDEIAVGITGTAGEYRFDAWSSQKQMISGLLTDAISPHEVAQDVIKTKTKQQQPQQHSMIDPQSMAETFKWLFATGSHAAPLRKIVST